MQELTKEQREELLGKAPKPSLYYKFGDYKYNTNSKERVLSGIDRLDELTKGFEMGCITIWTGLTNAGKTTVMTMITKQTIEQGEKVFYFNGEQTKDDFKNNGNHFYWSWVFIVGCEGFPRPDIVPTKRIKG